ncbi:uncharacterized protein LOC116196010 isoform X2 [Punica granatum]|uniref:Uncharacterized protein LOC116196010 isoform X2 n=1 Tax=Punica granatum TaxID=22663 RepID=A0A6P8CBY3_PUNGR|nr:uncharacterized protein LOC116196010 isoform X2 [Punica granatum]
MCWREEIENSTESRDGAHPKMSRIRLSPAELKIYCDGMDELTIQRLLDLSGFKRGILPVRYLGVTFIPVRLTDRDCKSLIDKITSRIEGWVVKKFSYAGKLQLAKSVIHSQVNFWCCAFVLPKKVLKMVEKKCKAFL